MGQRRKQAQGYGDVISSPTFTTGRGQSHVSWPPPPKPKLPAARAQPNPVPVKDPVVPPPETPLPSRQSREAPLAKRRASFKDVRSDANDLSRPQGVLTHEAMLLTMPFQLQVAATESRKAEIVSIVDAVMALVDRHFNNWNPDSEISAINSPLRQTPARVSPELGALLDLAESAVRLTSGRFDPTVLPLLEVWRESLLKDGREPHRSELQRLSPAVGWTRNVQLVRDRGRVEAVELECEECRIDLGGVAKGHALDLLGEALVAKGFVNWVIEWGGDVLARGVHPQGRPWRTCLARPPPTESLFTLWTKDLVEDCLKSQGVLAGVDLHECAAATSGDFFQVYKFGYHHIVDGESLSLMRAGQEGVACVTVVAASAARADAFATAAMACASVEAAAGMLDRLVAEGHVGGFCLLSRARAPVMRGGMFHAAASAADPGPSSGVFASLPATGPPDEAQAWLQLEQASSRLLPPRSVLVETEGTAVEVPTLATVSLRPLMVSFVAPHTLPLRQGSKARVTISDGRGQGRVATVRVVDTLEAPGRCVVALCGVDDVEGAGLETDSLPDRLKAALRDAPAQICIVTFTGADSTPYAVTASSVRMHTGSCFVFNLQLNSRAGMAAEELQGRQFRLHYLSGAHAELAKHHSVDPVFDEGVYRDLMGREPPSQGSDGAPCIDAGVTCVVRLLGSGTAGDHLVLVCGLDLVAILDGDFLDDRPLIYRDREFAVA